MESSRTPRLWHRPFQRYCSGSTAAALRELWRGKPEESRRGEKAGSPDRICRRFIFTAIGMLIPVQLSYLFLDPTPEILTMAVPAIRLYFLCFLVSEWNIISGMYFQSTVRPRFSLTITLLRGVILNSVFVFLLRHSLV